MQNGQEGFGASPWVGLGEIDGFGDEVLVMDGVDIKAECSREHPLQISDELWISKVVLNKLQRLRYVCDATGELQLNDMDRLLNDIDE